LLCDAPLIQAGERIAQKYGRSKVRAIFLHAVSDKKDEQVDHRLPQDRLTNGVPIYYFRTYVGAAAKACKNQLISRDGLQRVIEAARADLTKIPIANEDFSRNLERDIAEAKGKKAFVTPSAFLCPPSKLGLFAAFGRSSITAAKFWKQ
jgi:hypothetical protein